MKPTYHTDFRQWSDEWYAIRAGRLGGASSAALLVNGKNGNGLGVGAMTLIYTKAAEIVIGPANPEDNYTNPVIERGIELEPIARRRYEDETFSTVSQVGYVSCGEYLGFSPDGLVGQDGLIEIKCPTAPEFVRFVDTRKIQPDYIAQMQWGMFITGRKWCDFIVYHPDFRLDLVVQRVYPDPDVFESFSAKVPVYIDELERVVEKLQGVSVGSL